MTSGRRALLRVLQTINAREVAARVRVHEASVSRWASGAWKPSPPVRVLLEQHCQIPAALWSVDERPAKRSA